MCWIQRLVTQNASTREGRGQYGAPLSRLAKGVIAMSVVNSSFSCQVIVEECAESVTLTTRIIYIHLFCCKHYRIFDMVNHNYSRSHNHSNRSVHQKVYVSVCVSAADKVFAVPIVPLTEENETAIEDPVFMDFLRRLGLSPPANEQVGCTNFAATRVRTDHGNLGKSWNSEIKIPGLEKSWHLKYCLKSWKGHGISNKSFKKSFIFMTMMRRRRTGGISEWCPSLMP